MLATIVGIVSAISMSALGWAFATNSKVNVLKKEIEGNKELSVIRQADLKELINEKFDGVNERLARIERGMNGGLKGTH